MTENHSKKKVLNGIKWSSYSSLIVAAIQFVLVIILALYLQKKEMGEIAIIQSIVGITIIFLDMGISNAVVHKKDITKQQLSSVYWVNIASGFFFTSIIFFSAIPIANYYDSNELVKYIQIISISFLILSISRLYKFLFIKKLELRKIAISEILSYSISFISLWILLYLNFKVLAFVYSILIRSIIQSIYLFIYGLKVFKPLFIYDHKSLKYLFNYGLFNLGQNLTIYINSQLDVILIGRLMGMEVLGVYSVAKVLASKPLQLISPIISKITFPLMSNVQFDNEKLKNIYLKAVKYLFSIVVIIYLVMLVEASDLIHIIYKNKWDDAIILLQLLTILYIINAIGNPIGSLILASGKVKLGFYWNLIMLLIIPIIIYFSSFYGIKQIIISLITYQLLSLIISYKIITKKILRISLSELLTPLLYILLLVLPSIITIVILSNYITNPYIRIIGLPIIALLVYILSIYKFNNRYFKEIKNNLIVI